MILGDYSPQLLFKVPFYVTLITLVLIYQISQYYHHEPPFPHCWISKVAQHYPEFVFFRFATISGAAMIILGWYSNWFYLKSIARQRVFNLKKYRPQFCVIAGTMGCFLLMGSTATIDTGKMNNDWHVTCASTFFVLTLIAQIYNTIIGWIIYSNIKTISLSNLYFKTFLVVLVGVQLWISNHFGEVHSVGHMDNSIGNDWDKFVEWSLTSTIMSGFYAMALDMKNFIYVYELDEKRKVVNVNI